MSTRVMIVEDNEFNALAIEQFLVDFGFANAGKYNCCVGALKALEAPCVDVVLLDVTLADGDCWSIADRLAAAEISYIFLTGTELYNIPEKYRTSPILIKPFKIEQLYKKIQSLIKK